MNGGWEWLRQNWVVIVGLIIVGLWMGDLRSDVQMNTKSFQAIDRKISHVLCRMGEESQCIRAGR